MVFLLYWQALKASELRLAKAVQFMGGQVNAVDLSTAGSSGQWQRNFVPKDASVIARAETLAALADTHPGALDRLVETAAYCFVYGFETGAKHAQLLRLLTSGGIDGVNRLGVAETEFSVEPDARQICRQFAGQRFAAAETKYDFVFKETSAGGKCQPLVRIGERPFLAWAKRGNCELLLVACRDMADVDELVAPATRLTAFFSRLAPLLMFLYRTDQARYWHNDSPRACLIIDDPLLQERYGFLEYARLLELMERERFSTSIAFIPWNYRRSSQGITDVFSRFPHRFSLCVHGCDHTGREFGSVDLNLLRERAQQGLQRMRRHRELTGLDFDEVMVFPQGCFSTKAIQALKSCRYLAAVNSTPYPVDLPKNGLPLRCLLEGAVTEFSGFPLFVRRYPAHLADLAFDLFLGKPALIVEHHGYFRKGYEPLAQTVKALNRMEPKLEWSSLSGICSSACLKKEVGRETHVRCFTDKFRLRNNSDVARRYVLWRRHNPEEPLPFVTVDRVAVQPARQEGDLRVDLMLEAGQSKALEIQRTESQPSVNGVRRQPIHSARVFVRRHLSEFRDNHVDRNLLLSRMALGLRHRLVILKSK